MSAGRETVTGMMTTDATAPVQTPTDPGNIPTGTKTGESTERREVTAEMNLQGLIPSVVSNRNKQTTIVQGLNLRNLSNENQETAFGNNSVTVNTMMTAVEKRVGSEKMKGTILAYHRLKIKPTPPWKQKNPISNCQAN
ncbi:hypothetical protein ACOMHN_021639 [Nucella lapillus]